MIRGLHHHAGRRGFSPALTALSPRRTITPGPGAGEEHGDGPREIAVREIHEQDISSVARTGEQKMTRKILAAFGISAAIALTSMSVAGAVANANASVAVSSTPSASATPDGPPWG